MYTSRKHFSMVVLNSGEVRFRGFEFGITRAYRNFPFASSILSAVGPGSSPVRFFLNNSMPDITWKPSV